MRAWLIRFVTLYVFDVVVLLVIGLIMPQVSVGWSVLWAAVILALATLWVKPALRRWLGGRAERSSRDLTRTGAKLVQGTIVLIVAAVVWVLVVVLSGVGVAGFFWGWVIPPVLFVIAWLIYDAIDDRLEAHAGRLWDGARGRDSHGG
ncbi:hypothetical protein [Microbacterium schleiferi]|uniref:Phage holin family protein n=1 Tax=Microbacterium schleiferi TaxID=69362 RepID=A0ABU7V2G2_9MICO|nr:hypothetical protein [Microbacterium schleiferi]MBD3751567.1 hypothetical protein [Micrococcales bacterium]MCC4268626.1 hypothetical protein [Microbacterium schleiferi]